MLQIALLLILIAINANASYAYPNNFRDIYETENIMEDDTIGNHLRIKRDVKHLLTPEAADQDSYAFVDSASNFPDSKNQSQIEGLVPPKAPLH